MDRLKYIKLENEDGSYSSSIPLAVDSNYVDVNGSTLTNVLTTKANVSDVNTSIANLQTEISSVASGGPAGVYDTVTALTIADPDHSRIYLVTADNHWYYYNNGWQDGGLYQVIVEDDRVKDLEGNQIIGEANGSEIVVTDAYNTRSRYLGIDASETKQITTQGTNYFNASIINNVSRIVVEDEGATIKMPIHTSGQGYTWINKTLKDLCPNLQVDDKVYLYFTRNLGTSTNNYVYLDGISQTWQNGTSKTITEQILNSAVSLYANNPSVDETTQCVLTNFRIVKNTTDNWEKFTNNQASPNPEYPQNVETMVGYRNLLDINDFKSIQLTSSKSRIGYLFNLDKGIYTISDLDFGDTGQDKFYINMKYDGETEFTENGNTSVSKIITMTSKGQLALTVPVVAMPSYVLKKGMLVEDTEEKPYVPYGTNYIAFDEVGKNLLNKDIFQKGYINNSGEFVSNNYNCLFDFVKVMPNTEYTFSTNARTNNKAINYYDINKNYLSKVGGDLKITQTGTTPANCEYIRVSFASPNPITQELINGLNPQLEQSTQATSYELYQHKQYPIPLANQELLNKNNYVDKIIVDESTGQSYIEKRWRKIALAIADMDNSEDFPGWKNVPYLNQDLDGQGYLETLTSFMCNISNKSNQIAKVTFNSLIYLEKNPNYGFGLTQSQWKEQYPNLIFELYYRLQTPQLIPIDNPNIKLLNGVNHITNSEGAEMDIVYVKDINTVINSLNARIIELEQAE